MDLGHLVPPARASATGSAARGQRRHYRHQIQTLAYLNLDQSNGGIIRDLGDSGVAVQAVARLSVDQHVFLRFDLANPRVRVEGKGRVAWADPVGQAGIEFLALSQRSRRGLKEWILIQLLASAQTFADSTFAYNGDSSELLFSSIARPAIRLETGTRAVSVGAEAEKGQEAPSLRLPWFPVAISSRILAPLVDGLILLSALLLFAVICMAMIGGVPAWPLALFLGVGVSGVLFILYRFLFLFWIGGTPGTYVAGLTSEALNGVKPESEERSRFR